MEKKQICIGENPNNKLPFSEAIISGNILFISGTGSLDLNTGKVVGNDLESQMIEAMKNIKKILEKADMNFGNVVKSNIYITNMDEFHNVNKIYKKYFEVPLPARTCIEVSRLPVGFLIEIEMIAIK
jgi:2-iminobutanoate/2-iminopropanoate deaminase